MQQHARLGPVALDRALRDARIGRDLGEREAAEELQIHQLGEFRVELAELVERLAEPFTDAVSGRGAGSFSSAIGDELIVAAALLRPPARGRSR